jgi:hypothetical protein
MRRNLESIGEAGPIGKYSEIKEKNRSTGDEGEERVNGVVGD